MTHTAVASNRHPRGARAQVIHDVLDFLSRNQSALRSDFCSLPQLTAEVQKAVPSLKLPKSTSNRIFS